MLLAGITVDIACFVADPSAPPQPQFQDRFSIFPELEKLSLAPWSFSAEIGAREAFGYHSALCAAVLAFRKLLLTPRLFTTGMPFADRRQATAELEQLADAGVQQIILRVNEDEARELPSGRVRNLVEACTASGIDLRLQFELDDTFSENCCRIAQTVEDRLFTVTLLPIRIRPVRLLSLENAPPIAPKQPVQLVLSASGDLLLRVRAKEEAMDVLAGSVERRPLRELVAAARAAR